MSLFQVHEVDEDLRRESMDERRQARRMFAYCSTCQSNGHRPGCPEESGVAGPLNDQQEN